MRYLLLIAALYCLALYAGLSVTHDKIQEMSRRDAAEITLSLDEINR